jgi:type VI secretion system protein ImpB
MGDHHPEHVGRQIPRLPRLIRARTLLQDLRNRVFGTSEFRRSLDQIVRDPAALDRLICELVNAKRNDADVRPRGAK